MAPSAFFSVTFSAVIFGSVVRVASNCDSSFLICSGVLSLLAQSREENQLTVPPTKPWDSP